jgi:L-lactate dehydrogenase complex protein LldF
MATTAETTHTDSHTAETYSQEHASAAEQFFSDANEMTGDLRHRALVQKALGGYYLKRDEFKARYVSWQEARQAAGEIKWEAVNHLDRYLDQFAQNIAANGAHVFWAEDGKAARDYILEVCKKHGAKIVKSKTMTS